LAVVLHALYQQEELNEMAREQFIIQVAETVNEMFAAGKLDPSADEIAKAHFQGRALAPEIIESIRKRLHRIREVLETGYDLPVYLLSYTYYLRFRWKPPITDADARRCLPGIGKGCRVEGLRIHSTGDDDLIYQAMLDQNYSSGAGKVKKAGNRVLTAVEDHRLGEPHAGSIMRRGMQQAQPDNLTLARKVMRVPRKGQQQNLLLLTEGSLETKAKGKANGGT
jgi:hypothetical protein